MQIQALFKKSGAAAPAKKGTSSTKVVKPSGTRSTKVNIKFFKCSHSTASTGLWDNLQASSFRHRRQGPDTIAGSLCFLRAGSAARVALSTSTSGMVSRGGQITFTSRFSGWVQMGTAKERLTCIQSDRT